MGEAKQRGFFEQRKYESIERHRIEVFERRRLTAKREAAKTPEQRQKERHAQVALANVVGMAAGLSMGNI